MPRDAGLLLLIGVINVVATALAHSYVRLLRQRPVLLLLDLAAGAAVVWLSGSRPLPFLPYALGALVLPALALGWRGALIGAIGFVGFDLVGLGVINPDARAELSDAMLLARLLAPFAFAGVWLGLSRLLPRAGRAGFGSQSGDPSTSSLARPITSVTRQNTTLRLTDLARADRSEQSGPGNVAAPLLLARTTTEQPSPARRVLYALPATPDLTMPAALEQLASAATRQAGIEARTSCSGTVRVLTAAQQSVLLRTAQEALQNVQQHARAHTVLLALAYEPRAVTLVVQDDGVGLLDGTYERPGLHALRAVRYRLAELDGQLAVFESESGGVTVRATLPIEQ